MTEITTYNTTTALGDVLTVAQAAQMADYHAQRSIFARNLAELSANTRSAYQNDLATWASYLSAAGIDTTGRDWFNDVESWANVSHGLVDAFKQWLLRQGLAVGTINRKLACVRKFCAMAHIAGTIDSRTHAMIQAVKLIKKGAGIELDRQRPQTRTSSKKAHSTKLGIDHVQRLKTQPDTPQGRRDALLMCLLLDHGLRSGELAGLTVDAFNLHDGVFTFYREKVKKVQTHRMTPDTLRSLRAYIDNGDAPALGQILRASVRSGQLAAAGMTRESISRRVRELGKAVGVDKLSAHDCRHSWTTRGISAGTDIFAMQQAGGWSSVSTLGRYVDENTVANDGVKL